MAKKCKDCDPNKYIEGVAYRGKNGYSFDGVYTYNDVGQPYDSDGNPTTDMLANVSDLLDAYNPIFTSRSDSTGLPSSLRNPISIRGIDKDRGFWFIWSFVDGMIAYNTPRASLTPPAITSQGMATTKINESFLFEITTDQIPSAINYTDFGKFADSDSIDKLRFSSYFANQNYTQTIETVTITVTNSTFKLYDKIFCKFKTGNQIKNGIYTIIESTPTAVKIQIPGPLTASGTVDLYTFDYLQPNDTTNYLLKNKSNYVGYYTGLIISSLTGTNTTYTSKKSLTIKSLDSEGRDPIYVTSPATATVFRGNSFNYQFATNYPQSAYDVIMNGNQLDVLKNLGLTWNSDTKTLSGTITTQIEAEIKTETWTFEIRSKKDADAGNKIIFNLNVVKGNLNPAESFPTIAVSTVLNGTVGSSFNSTISNSKGKILGISNLPEGLAFDSSNGKITGTPKHAGTFTSLVGISNARGSATGIVSFNFNPYEENNQPSGGTFPSEIKILQNSYSALKNNKITMRLQSKNPTSLNNSANSVVYFKKINKSEYTHIKANDFPASFNGAYSYTANSRYLTFTLTQTHNYILNSYLDVWFSSGWDFTGIPNSSIRQVVISLASPAVVTLSSHGFSKGQAIKFTTNGKLPTSITANTVYYAGNITRNTFNIYDTEANAIAGGNAGRISTKGQKQSGTHLCVPAKRSSSNLQNGTYRIVDIPNNTSVTVDLETKTSGISIGSIASVSSYIIAPNGETIGDIKFTPRDSLDAETNFWVYIIDINTQDNYPVNIEGSYDIAPASSSQIDAFGNSCYAPENSISKGAVSTPYTQEVAVTASSCIKSSWSANPAENMPAISFNPGPDLEHQIVFTEGPLGTQTAPGYSVVTITKNKTSTQYYPGPSYVNAIENGSIFANQTLPKTGLKKYPNGIPAANGVYNFFIKIVDTCAFNRVTNLFTLFLGTYTPRAGDVYNCSYTGTCFTKSMRVNTPKGKININELKVGDEVYAFDEEKNIKISKIIEIFDHNKEPQPIYKVTLENGIILETTLSHPFLDENNEFRFLEDFKIGEYLISSDNKKIKILDIKQSHFEEVYNIEVEKYHTYIIEDIFVHNRGGSSRPRKGNYTYWAATALTSNTIPGNCTGGVISQVGNSVTYNNYLYQYRNNLSESKDIGITSLTNISLLDILGEGPIEGIVDYEIKPRPGYQKGDIGYKNGVDIIRYPGQNSFIRSIYWNETALADDTYPNPGSVNFDFIKLKFDNADSSPRHANLNELKNINLEEEFYSKKAGNGIYVNYLEIRDQNGNVLTDAAKLPRRLTSTKTAGIKLFGKRKFQDGTEKTYKKSINVLTKDLYGLRLHIKVISLFKQIVDLTIWDSADQAAENSVGGRIDRQSVTFNISLKRIDKGSGSDGLVTTPIVVGSGGKTSLPLIVTGRLNAGPYIETFEWTGLNAISNEKTIGWEIEIEPTYIEPIDSNIVLRAGIDSVTEVYNELLAIPHTAGIMTTFDARFFTSIPQRSYDARLLKVKVPTNYNPWSKTYDGIWDGSFKLAWTDNPAWCFYDILTNRRYGLGKYVDPRYTDKWTLYEISKYCDELVNDGKGGLEPRFTCNLLIATREDAYKVVNDMASIFRGLVYYSAGLIMTSQDRPKDPIYIFNNSNVKDGEFTYSNTSRRVRRNIALVRYNDKDNFFKPAVKYVENREGIIKYGIRETEVSAFGSTSEGQAERLGKWTLLSENSESELISFETSLPAMYLKPGDIILVQDQNRQNKILGGRTYELNKNYAILDVKYEDISGYLPVISGCKFNILTPAGNIELGTPTGNYLTDLQETQQVNVFNGQIINNIEFINTEGLQSGINTSLIRRKQIQTVNYNIDGASDSTNSFGIYATLETGNNYYGYTKLSFGGASLDDKEHTLLQNTVWTIELDPNKYDYTKSPSISGKNTTDIYPGAALEPYMDKTQKFRVLDIEEQEEYRYKITALQYDENKYALGDDI